MTTDRVHSSSGDLENLRQGLERCEARHVGQEYPFCEDWGCMQVRELFDLVLSLQADLEQSKQQFEEFRSLSAVMAGERFAELRAELTTAHADLEHTRAQVAELTRERDTALTNWEEMTTQYERVRHERTSLQADLEHTRQIVGERDEVVEAARELCAQQDDPWKAIRHLCDSIARLDAADVPAAQDSE